MMKLGCLIGFACFLGCINIHQCTAPSSLRHPVQKGEHSRWKRESGTGFFFGQNISFGLQPPPPGSEFGPWGPWTDSSECSRTCGGGIAFQDRICYNVRADGHHSCVGSSRRYFSCNIQACPVGSKNFRHEQCSRFNTIPYEGKHYSWLPYFKGQNPCELNCMPRGAGFYTRLARKVIDGTRCYDDTSLDVCVDGVCMPVGCDMILGSTTKEDKCRVCGGDGTSCQIVKGVFDEDNFEVGYNDVLLIPAGATSILVKEQRPTNNYLAIRNAHGEFYLNGNWRIEFPRNLKIAGTIFYYERSSHGLMAPETIRAHGPTSEAIFIVLLYQDKNLGVSYEYSIPVGVSTAKPDSYSWMFGDFEECTRTCGGGLQHRPVRCTRNSDREAVSEDLCDPTTKPPVNISCNTQACPAGWEIGEWSNCSHACGGGTQFRLVFCHALKDGNSVVLTAEETCDEPKPVFMRTCNEAAECPEWMTGEWSECSRNCGHGLKTRDIWCSNMTSNETIDTSLCNSIKKPDEEEDCTKGPCEGVEWILSEWSGCDGLCSPGVESREAHCANENGDVFPNEACEPSRLPELSRSCPPSSMCEPMWHTSQWTECSVSCGHGMQTRVVFCGVWEDNSVIKIDESKCTTDKKFANTQNCSSNACEAVWFIGPWNRCSSPCGGGERTRKLLCFHENHVVPDSNCNSNEKPFDQETCNMMACDGDDMMLFDGCKDFEFGCCPDGVTAAGPNFEGCSLMNISSNSSCDEVEFGCCPDGFTLALGPFKRGCPGLQNCSLTKHGCCSDGIRPSTGPDFSGCAELTSNCSDSEYGCCPDGITPSDNENMTSCSNISTTDIQPIDLTSIEASGLDCNETEYGCCDDELTPAMGPEMQGCDIMNISIPEHCLLTEYGCCEDNMTAAKGPMMEGCFDEIGSGSGEYFENCNETMFGCCPDNETRATGFDFEGCPIIVDCNNSSFGCCPDNITLASGPEAEGCIINLCESSKFGCCPDNVTYSLGPNFRGCSNCNESIMGCCPDNVTFARGPDFEGCNDTVDCTYTEFGCCPDNVTVATGSDLEGCVEVNCSDTEYGCCPDNVTVAGELGCPNVTDCNLTDFGCCPDNVTSALGEEFFGCELSNTTAISESTTDTLTTVTPAECENTLYGCCPDMKTPALGFNLEGCCFGLKFGCCPDNLTAALGPQFRGCSCHTYPYGCCPDGLTPAQGYRYYGCKCEHFQYGCCPDGQVPASGPNFEGCRCSEMRYGCCPDGITPMTGPNAEGCGCISTRYGCCPDGKTTAISADLTGCPCDTLPYGCCPDGRTPARTSDHRDCPCEKQRYGCCLDGRTPAQGFNFEGCPCEATQFGCCIDGKTPAQGPAMAGCTCETSKYGCCPDGQTLARTSDHRDCDHGACDRQRYGCCPDERTPALGFNFEGCSCETTRFGCCSDGQTPAQGPAMAGCTCETSKYGCCPDGQTLAQTSDHRDCDRDTCDRQRYGCCPDGRTPALGFNFEGCSCETTRFGCCSDGKTTAQGPELAGCPCESSKYGCCPDGVTYAQDHHKKSCQKDVLKKVSSEVCNLPEDAGPCKDYIVKWFFNVAYGGCSRFWYGGCSGNGNLFSTQEECEQVCVKPEGSNACLLPKVTGSCDGKYLSYYYDVGSKTCETFYYGGCLGNNNRFASKELCEETCTVEGEPTTDKNICQLPEERGTCHEFRERWHYDFQTRQCHRFYYSGCDGNANNFDSLSECENQCGPEIVLTEAPTENSIDECTLPVMKGTCRGTFPQWHYESSTGECVEFVYTGCKGNANRFNNKRDCETRCRSEKPTESPIPTDICDLPVMQGTCRGAFPQWHYDSSTGECIEFVYSGCKGNANKFNSKLDCEIRCSRRSEKITESPSSTASQLITLPEFFRINNEDVCHLSGDAGTCTQSHKRWFYDALSQTCLPFVYTGCGGNKNRFKSPDICNHFCTGIKKGTSQLPITTTSFPTACPASNCAHIQCHFGIEEIFDNRGCSICRCSNPCEVHTCPDGSRCSIDIVRTSDGATRTEPVCRKIHKLGICPEVASFDMNKDSDSPKDCINRCRDDANCRGDHKCCNNGCAMICVQPNDENIPATQPEPASILPGPNMTTGRIGESSKLPCRAIGYPRPSVTWWKETTMLPISSSRFEQLSNFSLFIRSVRFEDGGNYHCQAYNGIGPGASFTVTLIIEVYEPPSNSFQQANNPP